MTQRLDISKLVGQFILGAGDVRIPDGWVIARTGEWLLGRHPSLPGIRLHDADDRHIGWILGYPIDAEGKLWDGQETMIVPGLAESPSSRLEQFIYGFGGRFAVMLLGGRHTRIYLDPCGLLSLVYCAHQKVVASTPNLIPYDRRTGDRVALAREMGIPYTNAMYPLWLTPRHNIDRLLPNHYLDLGNWQGVRHWPKKPLHGEASAAEAAATIATITKRNIRAVVSSTPTYLRLTAGQDSRMLLACARGVADRVELLTLPIPDDGASIDVDTARRIARWSRLRHIVPKFETPKQEDLDEYMFRISYGTGEYRGWQAATMFKRVNPAYAQLDGGVGGLERIGEVLDPGETKFSKITPERLICRCQAPHSTLTLSTIKQWLETVPVDNAFHILDLFEIEQRLGCWAGVWSYAECDGPGFVLFPMCHREIIERMMTLPADVRISGTLMKQIIEAEWPELLAWPFNKAVGFKRVSLAVRRTPRELSFQADRTRRMLAFQVQRVGRALLNSGPILEKIRGIIF
jgi:hypothetical protein